MDFFKFTPGADPSFLESAATINGIRTATWTERYKDPGEFKFQAPVSSQLRTLLPLGTMISHIDTLEVMIVENHEIDENVDEGEPQIIVSGRSLDSWFEQRIVGSGTETMGGPSDHLDDYFIPFGTSLEQATALINSYIYELPGGGSLSDAQDGVPGFRAIENEQHTVSYTTAVRILRRGPLPEVLRGLLDIDDFGVKVVRPNADNVDPTLTEFRVHNGVDRTTSVVFAHAEGDLKRARYLWSNKTKKTMYYVLSTYNQVRYSPGFEIGYDRRMLFVDAADLDSQYTTWPTGTDRDDVIAAMHIRGGDALAGAKDTNITSTDISATTRYKFRRDYDVGDLVTVDGNYDTSSVMRVIEHVEFQDENGESGYPTLSVLA